MTVEEKFDKLLRVDLDVNGQVMNAPYKVYHNGEYHCGYLRERKDGTQYIEILRPARHIGTVELPAQSKPAFQKK